MVFLLCRILAAALAHGIINPEAVKWAVGEALPAIDEGARGALEGHVPVELAHIEGQGGLFMPGHDLDTLRAAMPQLISESLLDALQAGVDVSAAGDVLDAVKGGGDLVDHFIERRLQVAEQRARAEQDAQADAAGADVFDFEEDDGLEEPEPQPLVEALADYDGDPVGARIILAAIAAAEGIEPAVIGYDDLEHLDLAALAACTTVGELHAEVERLRRHAPVGA